MYITYDEFRRFMSTWSQIAGQDLSVQMFETANTLGEGDLNAALAVRYVVPVEIESLPAHAQNFLKGLACYATLKVAMDMILLRVSEEETMPVLDWYSQAIADLQSNTRKIDGATETGRVIELVSAYQEESA